MTVHWSGAVFKNSHDCFNPNMKCKPLSGLMNKVYKRGSAKDISDSGQQEV